MRKGLEKVNGSRIKFIGIFERYGSKTNFKGYPEKTILFKDVKNNSTVITDHIWFNMTKGFETLGKLKQGDIVEFYARVKKYYKGYAGFKEEIQWENPIEVDYKLSHPTKIKRQPKHLYTII